MPGALLLFLDALEASSPAGSWEEREVLSTTTTLILKRPEGSSSDFSDFSGTDIT